MSQQVLLTPTIITKETLVILENNLVMANRVNRKFENQFVKIGSSLTIRKPNQFSIRTGAGLQVQNIAEPSVNITIDNQFGVDFQFTSQDLTLTIEEFSERYVKPAAAQIANQLDAYVMANVTSISNFVGSSGTLPSSFALGPALVGRRMDENSAPQDNRTLVLNPASYWSLAAGQVGLFVMPTAKDALVKGYLATLGNYEVYMDQNVVSLSGIANKGSTTYCITTAQGNGNTTTIYGGSTDTWAMGEVFTVAGVYNVNPRSKVSTGVLKNFIVTATTFTAATTSWVVTFSPTLVTSGPYQNASGPMSSAAAVVWQTGTSAAANGPQNIAFTRDAFGMVMVPLEIPQGVDFAARETYRNISIRLIRAYDINNDVFPARLDVLQGDTVYYDELACRLGGA